MRSLCAILLLGCVEEQAGGECREGTYRQKDGHCALDDSEPSATDDTGEPDPEPEPEPEPTDDTGDGPPPDDGGEPWPPTPSWMSLADATITFEGGATGARVGRAAAGLEPQQVALTQVALNRPQRGGSPSFFLISRTSCGHRLR